MNEGKDPQFYFEMTFYDTMAIMRMEYKRLQSKGSPCSDKMASRLLQPLKYLTPSI